MPPTCLRFLRPFTSTASSADRLAKGLPPKLPIPGIKQVLLISSAKGGVGKSATTVNIAMSVKSIRKEMSVGILDLDVFGPSIPKMMNLEGHEPEVDDKKRLIPLVNFDIKCMSMGFLIPKDAPVVWRGLMVMQGVQRLLRQVYWGDLDLLVIDLPPGTGDVQLSVAQNILTSGAIVISTPQDVSIIDARRGLKMLKKLDIPIFGLVENMSYFTCPNCDHRHRLFGESDLLSKIAKEEETQVLARIPFDPDIMTSNDCGRPLIIEHPDSSASLVYKQLAKEILSILKKPLT